MGYTVKEKRVPRYYQPGDWHRDRGGRWLILRHVPFVPEEGDEIPKYRMIKFLPREVEGQRGFFGRT